VIWAPNQVFEKSESRGRDLEREIAPSLLCDRRRTPQRERCEAVVSRYSPNQFVHGGLSLGQHIRDFSSNPPVVGNLRGCPLVNKLHQPSKINLDTALSKKRGVVHKAS